MVIKNIKETVAVSENILEILKYSHFNPTKEKLSKLMQKYHEDKDVFPFASFDGDKISGVIVVQKIENETYEIIDIAVDENYRGQGIASKLIDYVIEKLNIKILFAETDDDAVGFYEKYGFKTENIKNKEYTRYKCTLKTFEIIKLKLEDFGKCDSIWDLKENEEFTQNIYDELKSGNRLTFIYKDKKSKAFLGEISIVFNKEKLYTIKNTRIYLSRLIVKDTCRKKGIGTILCNYILEYCKNLGYKEMTLGVNLDNYGAIKLYHKLGFKEILLVDKDEYGEYIVLLKKLI